MNLRLLLFIIIVIIPLHSLSITSSYHVTITLIHSFHTDRAIYLISQ